MKKKRIAAAIGLMAALFATIVIPAVLYGYMIFTGASRGDSEEQPSAQDDGVDS